MSYDLKKACVAFLKDIRSQFGNEKFAEFANPLGLPIKFNQITADHLAIVVAITDQMGIDLSGYATVETGTIAKVEEKKETHKVSSSTSPVANRDPDYHTIYEDNHLIQDPRTIQTIVTSIQRDFPDEASQVDWSNYGWTFLVRYSVADHKVTQISSKLIWDFDPEKGKMAWIEKVTERDVNMRAPQSYQDYMVAGKIETPGWKTKIPTTNIKRQKITAWEIIPYDRKDDPEWISAGDVSIRKNKLLDLQMDRDKFNRVTIRSKKHDATPYYATDDEGRVKTAKASNNNAEQYFGFRNTKQRVKSTIKAGGKSQQPKAGHLPEHLQTASRFYNLPRLDKFHVAKKFYLYYTDGHILLKEPNREPQAVAKFTYSESREAYIPIPMMPLTQGQNRRIWNCVQSYLGIGSGKKTSRQQELESKIETPQVQYLPVMPWEVNRNLTNSNPQSKTAKELKRKTEARKKHRKSVKIK